MKRHSVVRAVCIAGILWLSSAAWGQDAAELRRKLELLEAYPDLIVVNGKIHTMDANLSQVQAMAVRNSRILALGGNDQIRFLAGPQTRVIDAKGRLVLPALVDSHTHPNLWGVQHWLGAKGKELAKEFNLPELASELVRASDNAGVLRGVERTAARRAQELGPGKWIVIYVFGPEGSTLEQWQKMFNPRRSSLTRQFLDSVAPNNPLIVFTGGGTGENVHNSRAAEEWVRIIGAEQTQGLMEAPQLLWDILLRDREDVAMAIMKREMLECLSAHGIGTFGDRYDRSLASARIIRLLHERGELPVRWGYFVSSGSNTVGKYEKLPGTTPDQVALLVQEMLTHEIPDFRGVGNDYIWMAGTANEAWERNGSNRGEGIACTKAELPPESARKPGQVWAPLRSCAAGINYEEQDGYTSEREILERRLRPGFLHGYSDGTYDALFHMLDQAVAKGQFTVEEIRAMRIGTEHNPIIRPDQIPLFAKYNIMPSFNGYQLQGDIKGGAFLQTYGEKVLSWLGPIKSLVDAGVRPPFNTDLHLTDLGPEWKSMESPEAWRGSIWAIMEFYLTRYMPSDGLIYTKSEAIDKTTMMKAATIWSAELLLKEKDIGSLEKGKLADFIILDKDYFTIPEDQVHTIRNLLTVVGGKITYQAPNF
ncbi:MAG TPA: amidohydrolase family protein [Terriglobia bacterium]|nr:amidohydrolase family protein [Terriglobia bacterium]